MSYYKETRTYYTQKPTIIHSRESSSDSHRSSYSRSSTDSHYASSRTSMANGYGGGSQSKLVEERIYRVPDDKQKQVKSTSRDGKTSIIHQNAGRIDNEEPRASQAQESDYRETKSRSSKHREHRDHREHRSKRS